MKDSSSNEKSGKLAVNRGLKPGLIEFDHETRLAVIHPELLRLATLDVRVIGHPLDGGHSAPLVTADLSLPVAADEVPGPLPE